MNTQPTRLEKIVVTAALTCIACLILLIATAPDPYTEAAEGTGGQICIEDEVLITRGNHPPEFYAIIYPVDGPNVIRDKNGEIVTMDHPLPHPATRNPAIAPDGHADHPVMPWIEQSLTGQSPPVLYWPAPQYHRQTLKPPARPCADRYKPVEEPGIIALIGAALLALAVLN